MADRYEDRYRSQGPRGYGREDRGFVERAGDEVRSWFGDDDARRRREMDERERDRYSERSERGRYDREYDRGREEAFRGRDEPFRGREVERDRTSDTAWASSGRHWSEREYPDRSASSELRNTPRWGSDRSEYESRSAAWSNPSGYTYGYGPGIWSTDAGSDRTWGGAGTFGSSSGTSGGAGWRQPGGYVGRGPKGYQRSDARIMEDVCDRLAAAPDVDASEIEVTVRGGEVTLSGMVMDRHQKRRSEDVIDSITGVREVHNNLRVSTGGSPGPSPVQGTSAPGAETSAPGGRR